MFRCCKSRFDTFEQLGDMIGIPNKFMFIENEVNTITEYIQRSTISQQETLRSVLDTSKIFLKGLLGLGQPLQTRCLCSMRRRSL